MPETTPQQPAAPAKSIGLLSSFVLHPSHMTFESQESDETVYLFLRAHKATTIPWIFTTLLLLAVPFVISFAWMSLQSPIAIPSSYILILLLFYYLCVLGYQLTRFLTWFYNIFIVTNKRVVDIDYSQLVIHNVATTQLSKIEDVNYSQAGFLASFINFGNLHITTAGDEKNFEAIGIPNPKRATDVINQLLTRRHHG